MENSTDRGDAIDPMTEMRNALNMAAAALATVSNQLRRSARTEGDEAIAKFAEDAFKAARHAAIPARLRT